MTEARDRILELKARMQRSIIGQEEVVDRILLGLLANGNLLIEGLPGLAKTRAIKSLAKNMDAGMSRIQFTPDLLPSDVTGTEAYYSSGGQGEFRFEPGPIFNNLVLADEINRAPAKVQAALLEAMEERQVTVAGTTHKLPDMFMVMATQNPIEQEGTYPLPEAQMDRFLMKILIATPTRARKSTSCGWCAARRHRRCRRPQRRRVVPSGTRVCQRKPRPARRRDKNRSIRPPSSRRGERSTPSTSPRPSSSTSST